jgi:hypothetical protein
MKKKSRVLYELLSYIDLFGVIKLYSFLEEH